MILEVKCSDGYTHILSFDMVEVMVAVNAVLIKRRGFSDLKCIYSTTEKAEAAVQEIIAAAEAGAKVFRFIPE